MKTKAYKLAAELGLHEQSVLDWLRANGYPNVRRADTIRAEVVQAARKALARSGGSGLRPAKLPLVRPDESRAVSPRAPEPTPPEVGPGGGDFRVSFAELLEAHLSTATSGARPVEPEQPRVTGPMPPRPPSVAPPLAEVPEVRLARADEAREAARREADEWRVRYNRVRSERDELQSQVRSWGPEVEGLPTLRSERERLAQEVVVLRQRLKAADDERATLESTCAELQEELSETRSGLVVFEGLDEERRQVQDELQSALQREMAWRARALELERAALLGGSLQAALSRAGVSDPVDQAGVLTAVLSHRDGATALLRMLRPMDADGLARLIAERLRRVCVDPVCNQVAAASGLFSLRVDNERDCAICGGAEERRWFLRMALECERAGVRRILVIGGSDAVQEQLRALSQGQRVDFRLVTASDELFAARVQGRVEGCDLLVLWGAGVLPAAIGDPYADAARREGRPVAHVVGARCTVVALARAVCNRLTRSLVLTTV